MHSVNRGLTFYYLREREQSLGPGSWVREDFIRKMSDSVMTAISMAPRGGVPSTTLLLFTLFYRKTDKEAS